MGDSMWSGPAADGVGSERGWSSGRLRPWLLSLMKFSARALLLLFVASALLVLLLRWVAPPTSSFMLQDKFSRLLQAEGDAALRYQWVDYEDISPHVKIAVVAAEDQNFPRHAGFDLKAIRKALEQSVQGRRLRGASTISQQVAKNLFLWPGRSYLRKGLEAYFTLLIELLWSKQRILEVYLNIAQMGDGVYGVEAASRSYFSRSAAQLNREQALRIAAVLPNPEKYSATRPTRYLTRRTQWISRQISQLGGAGYLADL